METELRLIAFALAIGLGVCPSAFAQSRDLWFSTASHEVVDFVDIASIKPPEPEPEPAPSDVPRLVGQGGRIRLVPLVKPPITTAWVTRVKRTQPKDDTSHAYSINLFEVNCVAQTLRIVDIITYTRSGKVIERVDGTNGRLWRIVPGSISEADADVICKPDGIAAEFRIGENDPLKAFARYIE